MELSSSSFCSTPDIMGFWPILGNIAVAIGTKLAGVIFSGDDKDKGKTPAPQPEAQPAAQPNITFVCDGMCSRNLPCRQHMAVARSMDMRRSLYEQDPQVLREALSVLQRVIEERGIPVNNEREASQFLMDMRDLLQNTRDRRVMNGVFEVNDAWSRACRRSPTLQGVGDLVQLLNSEGYRVIVTRDNSRSITNENTDASYCNSCDFQLPFEQLKHFCQYCRKIFCSDCCSYQRRIPPFRGNQAVCICHECKSKHNSNFSRQASSAVQTTPKVYNNIRNPSSERSVLQPVRIGNVNNNEDDVKINLVVPRHVAEVPEGWKISVQCKKNENGASEVSARTEKKEDNDLKWTDEHSKDKLHEKDVWQDNSNSKKIVTKSSMGTKSINPASERQTKDIRREEVESAEYRLKNSAEERDETLLQLALEQSRRMQMEDLEVQIAIEISKRESSENKERKFAEFEVSDEDEGMQLRDTRRGASYRKMNKVENNNRAYTECQEDDDEIFLNITKRNHSKNNTHSNEKYKRSENDEDDELLQIAFKRSLEEDKWRKECTWEEDEEAFKQAIQNSLKEIKQERKFAEFEESDEDEGMQLRDTRRGASNRKMNKPCYSCGQDECVCDEGIASLQAMELSRQESANRQEYQLTAAALEKIAMIEEEEIKLATKRSLQDVKKEEESFSEESEDEDEDEDERYYTGKGYTSFRGTLRE